MATSCYIPNSVTIGRAFPAATPQVITVRPATQRSYLSNVRAFLGWAGQQGIPARLDRRTVAAHLADMDGYEAASVKIRHNALRRYSAWLVEEGHTERDDLLGLRPPKVPVKIVQPLTDDELRRLLATCKSRTFIDLRDEAVIRLGFESGMRIGEILALRVEDIDLAGGVARVHRTKSGIGRTVPITAMTARSLDRYMRARRGHSLASTGVLFLGRYGQTLGDAGLRKVLGERAVRAGVAGFHPHRLRHTFAVRWFGRGGSERGAMSVGGWRDPSMMRRYAQAMAESQAIEEARRLDQLGDV